MLSSSGERRSGMWMEACTHGPLLIMRLESASNLLLHLEILCLNTNASQPHCRNLQRLMLHTSPLQASHQNAPNDRNGLILSFPSKLTEQLCTLQENHLPIKPLDTLHPPLKKTPRNNSALYQQLHPGWLLEARTREGWQLLCMSSQIRSPASVPRKAGDNTVTHL